MSPPMVPNPEERKSKAPFTRPRISLGVNTWLFRRLADFCSICEQEEKEQVASLRKAPGGKEMSVRCAGCGAVLSEGSTCQTIFEEFLSLEYTNPAYGQVHFLTVACFMIQHGRYSDEALSGIQSVLRAYLDEQLSAQRLRQRAAKGMNNPTRTWKVPRQADAPPLPKIAWSVTIVDVAQSMQDPEKYGEHVKQWAHTTLQQMPSLLL